MYILFISRSSNLPIKSTRLLNRSRVQTALDSPRSSDQQVPRPRRSSSLTKTPSPFNKTSSPATATDDLTINRSTRNTMIQDVLYFKKQLLRLRRLLQEVRNLKHLKRLLFYFNVFLFYIFVYLCSGPVHVLCSVYSVCGMKDEDILKRVRRTFLYFYFCKQRNFFI